MGTLSIVSRLVNFGNVVLSSGAGCHLRQPRGFFLDDSGILRPLRFARGSAHLFRFIRAVIVVRWAEDLLYRSATPFGFDIDQTADITERDAALPQSFPPQPGFWASGL